MFHLKRIQYSTWCQNRGCSCISSRRRTYRSNPVQSSIHILLGELQFSRKERKIANLCGNLSVKCHYRKNSKDFKDLQSSSPYRNSILAVGRLSRLPVQFPMLPSILPGRNFILCSRGIQQVPVGSPCCSRLHRNRIPNRISTCNSNTSTKFSVFQFDYLFLWFQAFCILFRNSKKSHSIFGTYSSKRSKTLFIGIQAKLVKFPNKYSENGYGNVRYRS